MKRRLLLLVGLILFVVVLLRPDMLRYIAYGVAMLLQIGFGVFLAGLFYMYLEDSGIPKFILWIVVGFILFMTIGKVFFLDQRSTSSYGDREDYYEEYERYDVLP